MTRAKWVIFCRIKIWELIEDQHCWRRLKQEKQKKEIIVTVCVKYAKKYQNPLSLFQCVIYSNRNTSFSYFDLLFVYLVHSTVLRRLLVCDYNEKYSCLTPLPIMLCN